MDIRQELLCLTSLFHSFNLYEAQGLYAKQTSQNDVPTIHLNINKHGLFVFIDFPNIINLTYLSVYYVRESPLSTFLFQ